MMFIVLLKFGDKSKAAQWMAGHNEWIQKGFAEQKFLLLGSLQPNLGGGILAKAKSLQEIQAFVNEDPFVVHGVVTAEILQISPGKADPRLQFLLE
jgi:uncharacterized protein YciI